MFEETGYNLEINRLKNQKLVLEREVANLILQRDKVYNEIADQREGCNIVYKEKVKNETQKYNILNELDNIEKTISKSRDNFVASYEKQLNTLNKIGCSIEDKNKIISQLEGTEQIYIDLYNKNLEIKKEYKENQINLGLITEECKKEKSVIEKERNKLEKEKEKFKTEYDYIQTSRRALEKREKQLKTYEERLKDLKLALTEQDNG